MSYLFWDEGITASTPGPFTNIQPHLYWLAEVTSSPADAWVLSHNFGSLSVMPKNFGLFAWAVHDGDVGAVPAPAALGRELPDGESLITSQAVSLQSTRRRLLENTDI